MASCDEVGRAVVKRRYVQIQGAEPVHFKSFGDPRVVSRSTGRVFPDTAALKAAQADDGPATELLHVNSSVTIGSVETSETWMRFDPNVTGSFLDL